MRICVLVLTLILLNSCKSEITLSDATTSSGGSSEESGNSCSFLLDGGSGGDTTPTLSGDKKTVSFSFNANGQIAAIETSKKLPDKNRRVFGVKISNPTPGIVFGLMLATSNIDMNDIVTTFSSNAVSIGGGYNGSTTWKEWAAQSSNPGAWYVIPPNRLIADGDVLFLYVDGTEWRAYKDGTLTADLGIQANNEALMASADRIMPWANIFNGGVLSGSIDITILVTKAELLAEGLDPNDFPTATQTLCGEEL